MVSVLCCGLVLLIELVWVECYCFSVVWLFLLMVALLLLVNSVVYYVHFTVGLTFVTLNLFVLGYMVRGFVFLFYDLTVCAGMSLACAAAVLNLVVCVIVAVWLAMMLVWLFWIGGLLRDAGVGWVVNCGFGGTYCGTGLVWCVVGGFSFVVLVGLWCFV